MFIVYVWDDSRGTRSVMVATLDSPMLLEMLRDWCIGNGWRVEVTETKRGPKR